MRSFGLLAICCGLACAACGAHVIRTPVNAAEKERLANLHPEDIPIRPTGTGYVVVEKQVVEERVEIPESQAKRETAAAGNSVVEPSKKRSAASEDYQGKREMPGTARVNAAPIFARSSVPLSKYKLDQGIDTEELETKQRILDAMAETPGIPNDGAAVTVITRGDKAILFGKLANKDERDLVENIARDNAKRVESHITLIHD